MDEGNNNPHLYTRLQESIDQFYKQYPLQIDVIATDIGVGIANEQGQIIKELALFPI
jgi:hypothetical protein